MYIGVRVGCWFTQGFFSYSVLEKSNSLVEWMGQGQISALASFNNQCALCTRFNVAYEHYYVPWPTVTYSTLDFNTAYVHYV
jgi:hypothetical protein